MFVSFSQTKLYIQYIFAKRVKQGKILATFFSILGKDLAWYFKVNIDSMSLRQRVRKFFI